VVVLSRSSRDRGAGWRTREGSRSARPCRRQQVELPEPPPPYSLAGTGVPWARTHASTPAAALVRVGLTGGDAGDRLPPGAMRRKCNLALAHERLELLHRRGRVVARVAPHGHDRVPGCHNERRRLLRAGHRQEPRGPAPVGLEVGKQPLSPSATPGPWIGEGSPRSSWRHRWTAATIAPVADVEMVVTAKAAGPASSVAVASAPEAAASHGSATEPRSTTKMPHSRRDTADDHRQARPAHTRAQRRGAPPTTGLRPQPRWAAAQARGSDQRPSFQSATDPARPAQHPRRRQPCSTGGKIPLDRLNTAMVSSVASPEEDEARP